MSDQFATVNGLAINGTEHFSITYNAGSVVLTVVSGALPASSTAAGAVVTQAIHPVVYHTGVAGRGTAGHAHWLAQVPPGISLPAIRPVSFGLAAMNKLQLRPRDSFGSAVAATAGDPGTAGSAVLPLASAASYNSMGSMNHMRFECGVDLKALMKTSRKQLVRALWASPDSPEALALGYMSYTSSH